MAFDHVRDDLLQSVGPSPSRHPAKSQACCPRYWPLDHDSITASNAGQVSPRGAAAAQHDYLRAPGVGGDEMADTGGHLPAVSGDVADEVPGNPVVDADRIVLSSAVPQPPLDDAPQAGPGRQVQEDDRVGGSEADRQAGGVVAV